MKRNFLVVSVGVLFLLGLLVGACGSSDDGSGGGSGGGSEADCQKVCDKVGECGSADDRQECIQDCPEMAEVIRASAWDFAVDCILDSVCENGIDYNSCLTQAGAQEPPSNIDSLADNFCNKVHECESSIPVSTCVSMFENGTYSLMLRIFTNEALDCIGTCVNGKSCDAIGNDSGNIESLVTECACGCGIVILCEST